MFFLWKQMWLRSVAALILTLPSLQGAQRPAPPPATLTLDITNTSAFKTRWLDSNCCNDDSCTVQSDAFTISEPLCTAGQYWDGVSCLTLDLVVDADDDTYDDASYEAGWAAAPTPESNDATIASAYYGKGFAAGYAAAPTPESNDATICGDAGGTWDAAAGTCTAAASEESMNCFQSAFCRESDDLYETGLPNSIVGSASHEECLDSSTTTNAWDIGRWIARLNFDSPYEHAPALELQAFGFLSWICE